MAAPPLTTQLDEALDAMLGDLRAYATPDPTLPPPAVTVVSLEQRPVGLGNRRGQERRGVGLVDLGGVRVDASVRFQLWGDSASAASGVAAGVAAALMADREQLWSRGFLRLALSSTGVPLESGQAEWGVTSDYSVLYEHRFVDSDAADSLIARIPISSLPEDAGASSPEITTVTDALVRWDETGAAALLVRGPASVRVIEALAYMPAPAPTGGVRLVRTHDDATGPPTTYAALAGFLDAVAGPDAPERHGECRFPTLTAFLAAMAPVDGRLPLGDWDNDQTRDMYEPRVLETGPPIRLSSPADRLEVVHENTALDQVAVVYLRVGTAPPP